ncbi:unnamed protein product [Cuscuta epithymum]|uniref:RNase H type-1 domain-containing protein n=1 Tax=Cuscuta epithymum TaxID=186058 RepID=A0AAV0GD45_9ASTE|nr:unnamed protein product [Cuscuta epithymum]
MISHDFSDLQVEVGPAMVVKYISDGGADRWGTEIRKLLDLSERNGVSYSSTWREANRVAHCLADQTLPHEVSYAQVQDFPAHARNSYFMDLFGLPSLRFFH